MVNLNLAEKVYVGSSAALKVYAGSTLIWEEASAPTPTMEYWFDFDGGSVGANVSTADAFGVPFTFASATGLTYSESGKDSPTCITVPDDSASGYVTWGNSTAVTSGSVGFWFKPAANAVADARISDFRTATSNTVGGILWIPEGRLRIMQGTSGLTTGQSPILPTGVWYWVSLHWDATAKLARLTVHDADGASLHDSGSVALTTSYTEFTTARLGRVTTCDIGASSFDMLQFDPGATAPIAPWLVVPAIQKPSALNTGHDPATIDGTVTGTQWLSTPGQILENKIVDGRVVVQANDVIIRNCLIRGSLTDPEVVSFRELNGLIENCTIEPTDPTAMIYNGIRGSGFTARYNDISKVCDGFSLYNPDSATTLDDVVVEYNFVHDLYYGPDPGQGDGNTHNDGVQVHGPGYATIRYNYFEMAPCTSPAPTHAGGTACFIVTDGASPTTSQHGLVFSNNWLTGNVGAMVNLAVNVRPTTVTVENNIIDKSHATYDPSYDILATTSANLVTPGLRSTDGYDTTNGNVDDQGNQVWVERVSV